MSETAGLITELFSRFETSQAISPEGALEHVRSSLGRGLPELTTNYDIPGLPPLSIAGGGPSLADTMHDMQGRIAAVNGSLAYLLDNNIVPDMCAVCDPSEWIADMLPVCRGVEYFIASRCHPRVFDRLTGCKVILWHCPGYEKPLVSELLTERGTPTVQIGGGSTICLRLLGLGYTLGFREFHCHGMDSSYRARPHAYEDKYTDDILPGFLIRGYRTDMVFAEQVPQFMRIAKTMTAGSEYFEPCRINVFGDGLLQHSWREANG